MSSRITPPVSRAIRSLSTTTAPAARRQLKASVSQAE
ncbi:hypothetical protein V494_01937, partial [Pseudogymnoascus sp. VKM F-4513 (FW-928)]